MSERNDILNQLKTDIVANVKSSSDHYSSDISKVKRGIFKWDVITDFPCVCFSLDNDTVDEDMFAENGTSQVRNLDVYLYMYCEATELEYNSELHQLVDDLEYFFNNDFTYKDYTYIETIGFIEGGISTNCSFADMRIKIKYIKN